MQKNGATGEELAKGDDHTDVLQKLGEKRAPKKSKAQQP